MSDPVPVPHKLAPLSHNKPLPSIGGLPPLRSPSALALLRPPLGSTGDNSLGQPPLPGGSSLGPRPSSLRSSLASTGSSNLHPPPSLGGSLGSTGGSSGRTIEPLGGSRGEGIDLLRSLKVSTQFEEEDTESESVSCLPFMHAVHCTILYYT